MNHIALAMLRNWLIRATVNTRLLEKIDSSLKNYSSANQPLTHLFLRESLGEIYLTKLSINYALVRFKIRIFESIIGSYISTIFHRNLSNSFLQVHVYSIPLLNSFQLGVEFKAWISYHRNCWETWPTHCNVVMCVF